MSTPRTKPSDLSKLFAALTELARSQDEIFAQIAELSDRIEKALVAATMSANETLEMGALTNRVTKLEHEVALLKGAA